MARRIFGLRNWTELSDQTERRGLLVNDDGGEEVAIIGDE